VRVLIKFRLLPPPPPSSYRPPQSGYQFSCHNPSINFERDPRKKEKIVFSQKMLYNTFHSERILSSFRLFVYITSVFFFAAREDANNTKLD